MREDGLLTLKHTVANPQAPVEERVSIYDQFVALHGAVMGMRTPAASNANFGHNNDLFLPWHRQYLMDFETELHKVDSEGAIPYWDWTQRQQTRSRLFSNNFLGLIAERQLHLVGGHFAQDAPANPPQWWPAGFDGWKVRIEFQPPNWRQLPSDIRQSLIRAGDSATNLSTSPQINAIVDQVPDYLSFRIIIEGGQQSVGIRTHNSGHTWVGGHMATGFSPIDPVFFMHHANVDRIWARWQANGHADDLPQTLFPGVDRDEPMWPWVGNAPGYRINNAEISDLVRDHTGDALVSADDILDTAGLPYDYA